MIKNIYDRLVFRPVNWFLDLLGVYDLPGFQEYELPTVYRVVNKWDVVRLAETYVGYTHALTGNKEAKKALGMPSAQISAQREVIGACLAAKVIEVSKELCSVPERPRPDTLMVKKE